ncbi:glycosyltransferase [Kocuria sp. KH4]
MRILQVVTYISPDGAYGGPVRVAINQAKALSEMGHEVVVAAAAGGFEGPLPDAFDGFPVHLFPARRVIPKSGFAGLTSPSLLNWLRGAMRNVDVIHVHLARDLVTLPVAAIALLAKKPLVVQTHGMIDHTDNVLGVPLDRILTRPVLRAARCVMYLTDREQADLIDVAGAHLRLAHLPNGVPLPESPATEHAKGPHVAPEALYLARLHPRKRPLVFVRAAGALSTVFPTARFSLVGADEGEGKAVRAALQRQNGMGRITWSGSVAPEKTLERMRKAAVYVLPSTDEPFPMAVLEAMSLGLPVIVTDTCGLAPMVQEQSAGIVCSDDPEDVERALARLLADPELRLEMGYHARRAVKKTYSMPSVAAKLLSIYITAYKLKESPA